MTREWTVKEFAAREQVDPRTVRRWISKGAIPARDVRRTLGGRIRISAAPAPNADNRGQSAR
jgi:predicted site-specific integrase-resolvase